MAGCDATPRRFGRTKQWTWVSSSTTSRLPLAPWSAVRPETAPAWHDHLRNNGLTNSSIRRKLTALRSLFSYLRTFGYLGANPAHSDLVDAPSGEPSFDDGERFTNRAARNVPMNGSAARSVTSPLRRKEMADTASLVSKTIHGEAANRLSFETGASSCKPS